MFEIDHSELILSKSGERSRGFTLDTRASRAAMIAETLGWAVRHNMPFQKALATLPFYREHGRSRARLLVIVRWLFRVPLVIMRFPWLAGNPLSVRLRRLIDDLDKGERLGLSLQKHLGGMFPDFYILGVGKAESENRLDTALPALARQMYYPCAVAGEQNVQLILVAYKMLVLGAMLYFLGNSVMPKFSLIFQDICSYGSVAAMQSQTRLVINTGDCFCIMACILLILPRFTTVGQGILFHVPVLGYGLKRIVVANVTHSMAAFLRQGDDVVTAAEWSMKAARSRWMRNRLEIFLSAMKVGQRWEDAWCGMKLSRPLDEWVIKNAAIRQDPGSGFELLAEWLDQETNRLTARIVAWIDPCCTLIIAAIVGNVAYNIFSILRYIIYALM